jgi:peptide/nickel transport system ATP-binding protein
MRDLRNKFNTAMIMITHDLGIVAEICDDVSVMYAGRVVEHGALEEVCKQTRHPYTEGLFNSLPNINYRSTKLNPIPGLMPDPTDVPLGCTFAPRCGYAIDKCFSEPPAIRWFSNTHYASCVRYEDPAFCVKGRVSAWI